MICGYQGWFTTKGDGSAKSWFHYSRRGRFSPGSCSIDLWPDVSELDKDEKYPTAFRHKDDRTAYVFSSHNQKTVLRHFQWMKEYGIDGVFVQRFAVQTLQPKDLHLCNVVLSNCREGANRHGRAYAVCYDLSGLRNGQTQRVVDDWQRLVKSMRIGRDPKDRAYLHHGGKPVVGIWGIGFYVGRDYALKECEKLIDFFKHDKDYGGCTVWIGVPSYWRDLNRDAVRDRDLHRIMRKADVVSPWSVGRYSSPAQVTRFAADRWIPDLLWCNKAKLGFMPVVFPGFSWHNMNPRERFDQIPRLKGRFLWKQFVEAKRTGATMIYVAMFDEMDEATAIFKCTNNPPVGKSRFLTYEGLPSDHYLWLSGMGGRLLRGEIKSSESLPRRPKHHVRERTG